MGSIITSLGAGIVYPNQVTLPAVNADRAGEVFIHQGQAWRFTDGTEGWDLPVGTPWPVKGYKEVRVFIYSPPLAETDTYLIETNTLSPLVSVDTTQFSIGVLRIQLTDVPYIQNRRLFSFRYQDDMDNACIMRAAAQRELGFLIIDIDNYSIQDDSNTAFRTGISGVLIKAEFYPPLP
jgi:hypothetical protein